jgi:hypothetical protein
MIDPLPPHEGNALYRFPPDDLNNPIFRLFDYTVTDIFSNESEVKAQERTIFDFDFVVILAARSRDDDSDPKPLSTWLSSQECPRERALWAFDHSLQMAYTNFSGAMPRNARQASSFKVRPSRSRLFSVICD